MLPGADKKTNPFVFLWAPDITYSELYYKKVKLKLKKKKKINKVLYFLD